MADKIKLDEMRAKLWIQDVNTEIELVEGVLKKVTAAMTEVPGEDDPIYKGIKKIGNTLTEVWNNTIMTFKKSGSAIKDTIDKVSKAAQELAEEGENVNTKMRQG